VKSGATILDDRETVELLSERPDLLAIADAVRATQSRPGGLGFRRVKGPVLAVVAFAVVTGAVVGGLTLTGHNAPAEKTAHKPPAEKIKSSSGGIIGPAGAVATLARPLGGFGQQVSLATAVSELGGPVTLPDSAQVKPSDAGAVWAATASSQGESSVSVAVTFPAQGFIIQYLRPPIPDPLSNFQGFVKDSPGSQVIYLNGGVPARAIAQTSDPSSWGSIEFVAGGTTILVMGQTDQATLQSVAQSILDRVGS
jgi:hypothetical protein